MLRYDTTSTLKQAKAALSITAQNEYVEVAPASLALIEAIKQLKKVKKEYDSYKHTRDDLKDKLHELKQAYKSKTPGIDGSDIEDLSDILENVNDEERYYKANIALAMANVEAKSLALIAQVAAAAKAASNWYTFGFSVGVAASVNGHKSKSNSNEVISNPSNLSANNIKIQTPNDTTITGSNLSANNLIDINTNNLNINSSKNTYTSESKDKSIGGTMRYTMYGGGGGSAGLNYSTSSSDTESLTNNNSHLYSAKDMNINTANDATIKGANLRADERLNLKVGNNLSLESVRDKYAYNERGYSVGVGIGFSSDKSPNSSFANPSSTKATSTNANFSRSSSNTITKQTVLSSITANELNVEVGKNTHLKGSLLAAGEYDKDNTFIDNHNLNLKTNTLSYENLSNTSYNKGSSLSIGANYSVGKKDDSKASQSGQGKSDSSYSGLKSIDLSNHRNLSYTLSKNLATLGSGNIEIADKDNSDDLTRLNRDTTKLTKDLVNTSISSNVDASMDARVLTADGREQIKSELEKVGQGITKIALKALLGNEVYKNTEIIIENLKRIKETDPQRYNEIVKAINEYNKEQEALKGSFIPAAVLPIAPAVLEFLVEIGAVSVALGGAYGAKKIGDKFVENSSEYDFSYDIIKNASNQQENTQTAEQQGGNVQTSSPAPLPPDDDDNDVKISNKNNGFSNKRILNNGDVQIKGNKNISLDVERGGSGKVNIHIKVGNEKYFYDFNSGKYISNSGSQLSSSISKNSKIQEATKKALDYANKIKDLK